MDAMSLMSPLAWGFTTVWAHHSPARKRRSRSIRFSTAFRLSLTVRHQVRGRLGALLSLGSNTYRSCSILEDPEMRLVVNHDKCRRTGQCVYLHPELFRAEADGTPVVLVEHLGEELREAAEEAVDLCPSGAIILVEE